MIKTLASVSERISVALNRHRSIRNMFLGLPRAVSLSAERLCFKHFRIHRAKNDSTDSLAGVYRLDCLTRPSALTTTLISVASLPAIAHVNSPAMKLPFTARLSP